MKVNALHTPMPPFGATLDLGPLIRNQVFGCESRLDSHAQVAAEFSDHDLRWTNGRVQTALHKLQANGVAIYLLRYGAEVEIRPRPFDGFVLVHMSIEGRAEIEVDGQRLAVDPGQTAVLAPRRAVRMRWQQQARQLIVKVPNAVLESAGLSVRPDAFPPLVPLPPELAHQWCLLVQSLIHGAQYAQGDATLAKASMRGSWLAHLENNLMMLLAVHLREHQQAQRHLGQASNGDRRRLAVLKDYMESRLAAPLTLPDLANATGVSVRTLNLMCHRYHGQPPMSTLRDLRLDAVRARLASHPQASVTEVALDYGFGHLGRFASYYRKRFGELPSRRAGAPTTGQAW